jgi:hypothetical protein
MRKQDYTTFANEYVKSLTPLGRVRDLIDFFGTTFYFLHAEGRLQKHRHYEEALRMITEAISKSNLDEEEMGLVLTAYNEGYERGRQGLSNDAHDHWNEYMTGEGPTLTPVPELKNTATSKK